MSYDIYIYDKTAKNMDPNAEGFGEGSMPKIPDDVKMAFTERLLKYDYKPCVEGSACTEFSHTNESWGIQVNVFNSEICFSIPFWDDAEDAVFEALMNASELCDHGDLVIYDPQTGGWVDA